MKSVVLVGLSSLVVACSGEDAAPGSEIELFGAGSRLVASWDQAPGAPRRFLKWYDPVLETSCSFYPVVSGDGPSRCLPTPSLSQGALTLFADDACTVPVAAAYDDVRWYWLDERTGCAFARRLFELGDHVDPASVFELGCVGVSAIASRRYHRLGTEAPSTDFVEMTVSRIDI